MRRFAFLSLWFACPAAWPATAIHPLDFRQTSYEVRPGESVQLDVPSESKDFLLQAQTLRVTIDGSDRAMVVGPNRTRDRIAVAAPLRLPPGEYSATITATSKTGEQRT